MENKQLEKIRHSLAHLLAMAVLEKYPGTRLGIGPAIENGFYYDFEFPDGNQFDETQLIELEVVIRKLISADIKFEQKELSGTEAKKQFANQQYKLELIEELEQAGEKISMYASGDFTDLCAGPHVATTKEIAPQAFKLTHCWCLLAWRRKK